VDCDRIARPDMISGVADGGGFDARFGHRNLSGEDQRFQPRARQFRQARCEHAVEPGRSLVAGNGDLQPRTTIRRRALFQRRGLPQRALSQRACMTETAIPQPTPEQAALVARVRRMMLIAGLTTALAIAAVLIAIGYRLFRSEGSSVTTDTTATLPKGARIVS